MEPIFKVRSYKLEPGDRLFLYTDGLLENEGATGKVFRAKQLEQILQKDFELDRLRQLILSSCETVWGDAAVEDDVSFILLEWQGQTPKIEQRDGVETNSDVA